MPFFSIFLFKKEPGIICIVYTCSSQIVNFKSYQGENFFRCTTHFFPGQWLKLICHTWNETFIYATKFRCKQIFFLGCELSSSITLGNEMHIYVIKPVMSADNLFSHTSLMSYVLTGPPLKWALSNLSIMKIGASVQK